jgi:hypothetical protein
MMCYDLMEIFFFLYFSFFFFLPFPVWNDMMGYVLMGYDWRQRAQTKDTIRKHHMQEEGFFAMATTTARNHDQRHNETLYTRTPLRHTKPHDIWMMTTSSTHEARTTNHDNDSPDRDSTIHIFFSHLQSLPPILIISLIVSSCSERRKADGWMGVPMTS